MSTQELINQPKTKYCIKCGTFIPQGAIFCGNCGYKIDAQVVATSQIQAPKHEPLIKRELKMHHIILTALFGLIYAIPASILLFRNNGRAAAALLIGGTIEALFLLSLTRL